MSDPIATPAELGLLLRETIAANDPRAMLVLALAQARCERWVSPLPASAKDVLLPVAVRAWVNIASANQIGMGSAYATLASTGAGGVGGLYLSKSEKAELRRLAGRSGAFSIDLIPRGRSEVQAVIVAATAGTYTLSLNGATTEPIAFDATAEQVQTALVQATGAGTVQVASGFVVTFKGSLANTLVGPLVADDTDLTGIVTVVTIQQGATSPWGR